MHFLNKQLLHILRCYQVIYKKNKEKNSKFCYSNIECKERINGRWRKSELGGIDQNGGGCVEPPVKTVMSRDDNDDSKMYVFIKI